MEKLVHIFLNTKYPNTIVKKTIFGELYYHNDDFLNYHELYQEINDWFGLSKDDAEICVNSWYYALPVVVSLRNSTNPAVLVSETTVVNSTL
jgi:hypothetical protein